MAIREDEDAAESLGVNTFKYKLLAMVSVRSLTSLVGTFYAFYIGIFTRYPLTLSFHPDNLIPITGGMGSFSDQSWALYPFSGF